MRNQKQSPAAGMTASPVMANGAGMANMSGTAPAAPEIDWSGELNGAPRRVIPYNDPAALQEPEVNMRMVPENGMVSGVGATFVEPNRHAVFPGTGPGSGSLQEALDQLERLLPQMPDMTHNLSPETIGNPQSNEEAYLGSLKATLARNVGNFIVATFLIGTQNMVSWEGILYSVGNDYLTIYQVARDRYVVCDLYSLKYMEFYDTRRRAMCNMLLERQNLS